MRLSKSLFLAATLVCFSLAAHADSVVFDFKNASFGAGYDVVGNITVDTTAGKITATNFSVGTQSFVGAVVSPGYNPDYVTIVLFANYGKPNRAGFGLYIPTADATLVGYNGGLICSIANSCGDNASNYYPPNIYFKNLLDGSLVAESSPAALPTALPAAATPEPSSLVLLGTGVLGVAGATRRRFITR